jgi:hypothetical protein
MVRIRRWAAASCVCALLLLPGCQGSSGTDEKDTGAGEETDRYQGDVVDVTSDIGSNACERVDWLATTAGKKTAECTSQLGTTAECEFTVVEADGQCYVSCPPNFDQRSVNDVNPTTSGFSYPDDLVGTITCVLQ